MKKMCVLLIIICFYLISCAQFRELNTRREPEKQAENITIITIKRAKIELHNSSRLNVKNAVIDQEKSLLILQPQKQNNTSDIPLASIKRLQYSNTNFGNKGFIIGGFSGLALSVYLFTYFHQNDTPNDVYNASFDIIALLSAFITAPLFSYIGHSIGKHFYYNWQEYDLSGIKKADRSIKPVFYLTPGGFRAGVSIPIR